MLLGAGLLTGGCRSDRVAVNPRDPQSPQHAYRLDELALLRMAADDIMMLERKRQYGEIYDQYASPDFQRSVSRRRFLIMTSCVESFLGGLQEFDTNDVGFKRQVVKGQPLDVLDRRVQRMRGTIDEQMAFSWNGLDFRLNSLYWISKDEKFLACIRASARVEKDTAPVPEEVSQPGATPEGATSPAADGQPAAPENGSMPPQGTPPGSAAPTENTNGPAASQETRPGQNVLPAPGGGSQTAPTGSGQTTSGMRKTGVSNSNGAASSRGSAGTPSASPVSPAPVQRMKPSEARGKTLDVRPAGAGAVEDIRPELKPPARENGAAPTQASPDNAPVPPSPPPDNGASSGEETPAIRH